jgi:hypothetical protein
MAGLVSAQTTGFIVHAALYEAKLQLIMDHKADRQTHMLLVDNRTAPVLG